MSRHSGPRPEAGGRDWRVPLRIEGPAAGTPASTHLVVGFDRHRASHAALSFAIELAARLNAYLHVVHVVDVEDLPVDPDAGDWEQRIIDGLERERAEAKALLAASPGNWTYHSHRGDPARLLRAIADAHDAAMILVGTPRRDLMSRMERILGDSVSARLIQHSRRPVVLVPEDARSALSPSRSWSPR